MQPVSNNTTTNCDELIEDDTFVAVHKHKSSH